MPESVRFDEEELLIIINSKGETTIEDWKESLQKALSISEEKSITEVLVDTSKQTSSPTEVEIFNFALTIPTHLKLAIFDPNNESDKQAFLEKIGQARDKNINVFGNKKEALTWLKS